MKPIDHYRLSMFLEQRKNLEKRLAEVNSKIERVKHQYHTPVPIGRRIMNWWFA